jgi:hypothetical protein
MENQLLTRNFALQALGFPTRRVGIPDFVAKNEVVHSAVEPNEIA